MSAVFRTHPRVSVAWQARSACQGLGVGDLFYRESLPTQIAAICARCPVRVDCLEHALTLDERYGIWGGATEEARRDLVKHVGENQFTARQVAEWFVRTGRRHPPADLVS